MQPMTLSGPGSSPGPGEPEPPDVPAGGPVRRPGRKRWAALALGVALSVIVAVLAFRGVDVVESWNLALQCRGWELALREEDRQDRCRPIARSAVLLHPKKVGLGFEAERIYHFE